MPTRHAPVLREVSTMSALRILSTFLIATSLHAGIVISRADKGFQFTDAVSMIFGGKDKVLNIGAQPKISGAKFSSLKPAGTIIKDEDSKSLAIYDQGALTYIIPEGLKNPSGDAGP